MSEVPMVSAVITTHNRLELLKRAVKSVYDQTYANIELIVVDDGSEDGTKGWCEKQQFKYIYIEPDRGKGGNYARNLGIRKSNGKYIAFLDDDDYWKEDKIEKQVNLAQCYDRALIYSGRLLEIVEEGQIRFEENLPVADFKGDMSRKILQTCCCSTSSTLMLPREVLIEVGNFDEDLAFWQDYELTIRLAQVVPFYYMNEALTIYRVEKNDNARLTNKYYGWKKAVNYIKSKHCGLFNELNFREKLKFKFVVIEDARNRCRTGQLYLRWLYYSALSILFKLAYLVCLIAQGRFSDAFLKVKRTFFHGKRV